MPETLTGWQLRLLGPPAVVAADGRVIPCERRTAALLAYLALEGPTSRATLVRLLWPDAPASASRNNLVHHLRRLKKASGADLVLPGEVAALAPALTVDAWTLLEEGRHGAGRAVLLDGVELDGCPDLMDWLEAQREELGAVLMNVSRAELQRLEEQGAWAEAISLGLTLLDLDPTAEDVWRSVIRLHYLNGDRPAALQTYHRCQDVLMRELGAEPEAATRHLARDIDRGTLGAVQPVARSGRIPLAVLRPPTLVGREEAWARMEEAWAAGQGIMLVGEAGSGKTRLALDFLRSRTTHQLLYFQAQPGDAQLPYATHARNYRAALGTYPDLALPGWVRSELARMLPELGQAPPPMISEADKRRFYDAKVEVIRLIAERGPVIVATDDAQFMDDASVEAGAYVGSRFWGDARVNVRTLFCHRPGELSAASAGLLGGMYDAGAVVPIHLAPLDQPAIEHLLEDLNLPQGVALAGDLARVTGGNPQLLLELLRHLFETGALQDSEQLPDTGGGVTSLIARRLARLTPSAQQAARAAAVLHSDFTPEMVAQMLGVSLLDVASAWEELEEAQIMTGERFSHSLILETVLAGIPNPVSGVLHRAAAQLLASQGGPAARIARHWQEGGKPGRAAPWLLKAGEAAEATLHLEQARAHYQAARQAFEADGDTNGAAQALRSLAALAACSPGTSAEPN
ncbi:ATP-binding protein [Deinococcus humi]|uniref:DNA-binding SARP family transcriptional activator n=1 Tax=Deinococcus humi TaxID=662880 RepID=A0A7W8JUI4_9DEIO|nr:BTAD domain-containing putative transcriptional regulator [Deinococcus humi]MBB5363455.1 DNA-binding SARP family transcriptional activator [Deinococcus humi]